MTEPMIPCPRCKKVIKLTASLAAPLIQITRQKFEQKLQQKDKDVAVREQTVHKKVFP